MYKKFEIKLIVISVFVILISGCASTGVVQMEKGVYFISEQETGVIGSPNASMVKKVYGEANQFCAKQGRVVQTINKHIEAPGFGKHAVISLEFRCVNK